MKPLEELQQHVPSWINWGAALTGLASVLTTWVPIVVGILSGVWISLQIWIFLFISQPWKKKTNA